MEMTTTNLKLPRELLEEAKALAVSWDRPLSWVIRHLLKEAIKAEKEKGNV
jgi:predicted transcriptional regulator